MSETNIQLFPGVFRSTVGGANPGFFLHSDGRVGIGNQAPTDRPLWSSNDNDRNKLNVSGHTHIDGNLQVTGQLFGDASTLDNVAAVITGSWLTDGAGGPQPADIKYDLGNVGIGGAASANKLKVHGDTEINGNVRIPGAGNEIQFDTGGAGLRWGLGYTRIVDNGNLRICTDDNMHFNTGSSSNSLGTERMILLNNGNIGIGTSSPLAKLHVQGTSPVDIASGDNAFLYWQMTSPGAYTFYTSSTAYDVPISIYASSKIATNADFVSSQGTYTASDSRIKRDIKELNDDDALVKLRQIQPKTYGYKDIGVRGEEEVIGFIADEVEEVLPTAVKKTTLTIPNILEVVNVAESNIISFTNFSTSNLSNTFTLECVDLRSSQDQYITIVNVIDDKTVQVREDLSNWLGSFDDDGRLIVETTSSTLTPEEYEALENEEQEGYVKKDDVYVKTTTSYPGDNLYIRGERVNDFRTLKKEMLFAINFSATQELDRQLQAEKDKVASLEERLAALEAIVLNQ